MLLKTSIKIIISIVLSLSSALVFSQDQATVVIGATVFPAPDQSVIEDAVIVLQDGTIQQIGSASQIEIPQDSAVIDASGKFITAGFWNSHVHYINVFQFGGAEDLPKLQSLLNTMFLRWGFVGTVDTGSDFSNTVKIRQSIKSGDLSGPQILTAAGSFVPVGGSPFYIRPVMLPEFTSSEQAASSVTDVLENGSDAIKIFTGSWGTPDKVVLMKPEHVKAATTAAKQKNALVFSHPSDSDGARIAIENGVDVLAHTFPSQIKGPWDKSLIDLMAQKQVALVPTLKLWRIELAKAKLPKNIVNLIESAAIEQVRLSASKGVPILFGTDVGYMSDPDTAEEFALMAQAEMDYQQVLAALTTAPVSQYSLEHSQGMLKAGYKADLVVLGSDPRDSIQSFADVEKTIIDGEIVFQR